MRNRAAVIVVILFSWLTSFPLVGANDCLALLTANVVKTLGNQAAPVFRIASNDGPVSAGLAAALRSREDGPFRVKQILDNFGEDTAKDIFGLLDRVKDVPRFGDFVVNLAKQDLDAKGAAATLRWATSRMDRTQIGQFEFPVPSAVADLLDAAGNLLEFKSLSLETYSDFVAKIELEKVRNQLLHFEAYARDAGKTVTLVFENPVPAAHKALFDSLFGEILNRGTVTFVNGF